MRSGSNLEAVLDLQEAYALATINKVLPQLVSEYGSGFKVKGIKWSPVHDWWILRGVNAKLMQLMNRPDRVVKAIPFIVGKAIWHVATDGTTVNDSSTTPYPFVLWRQREMLAKTSHRHLVRDASAQFYQMWEELPDGAAISVHSDNVTYRYRVSICECQYDSGESLAINSLRPWKAGSAPTKVDLGWLLEETDIQ